MRYSVWVELEPSFPSLRPAQARRQHPTNWRRNLVFTKDPGYFTCFSLMALRVARTCVATPWNNAKYLPWPRKFNRE